MGHLEWLIVQIIKMFLFSHMDEKSSMIDEVEPSWTPWQQQQPRQKHTHFGWNQSLARASRLAAWQKVGDFAKFGILRVFTQTFNAFSSLTQRSVCLPDVKPFLQSLGGKRAVHIKVVRIFMHFSDFAWHFLKLFSLRQTLSMKNLNPNG